MPMEAMERMVNQIKIHLQDSNQKNQEALQKQSVKEQKQTLSEGNPNHMCSLDNLGESNASCSKEKRGGIEYKMPTLTFGSSVKCNKCSDTGWIIVPQENRQSLAVSCECRSIEAVKNEWKYSGINVEMTKHTFANFKAWNKTSQMAKDTAVSYYNNFKEIQNQRQNSILFCGQVGSGKTHLSVALGLNFLKQKIKVVYMPYRDAITKIKQNILDQEYYTKTISKYQLCEVLLIDDLFKGKTSESDINIIFEIINYRYLNFLPIIVSSEFSVESLLNFDEAVGSRIYEMCKSYVVEVEKDIHLNYRLK